MKKIGLLLITILSFSIGHAQYTIISDDSSYVPTSTNALLEVYSQNGNKGILVPRLTTVQRTAITTVNPNDNSLLVYDTDTKTFWYFDGTAWVEIATGGTVTDDQQLTLSNDTLYIEDGNWIYLGGYLDNTDSQTLSLSGNTLSLVNGGSVDLSSYGNDWKLTGNAGTTAGTNFLGTTDNISLSFKTNNTERMRILSDGNVGIGTTTPAHNLQIQTTGGISSAKIGYSSAYRDNKLYFGDGSYVWIGEPGTDDRLQLHSTTLAIEIGGSVGSNGQVLTSNGTTTTWQTPNTYGTNNQGVSGTTDITLNSNVFTDMSQMTITFTPVHSLVYVYFTFSAYADPTVYPMEYVDFKILKDGTNVGGSNCLVEDYDDVDGIVTSFNGAMSLAVPVTAGVATTIKVQWRRDGLYTSEIYCNPASAPDYAHRSLIIVD